ncbi:hypothetical protein STRTUCAR8_06851, partial [Streptomyces turgidiscabies Car8]
PFVCPSGAGGARFAGGGARLRSGRMRADQGWRAH